ncbi:Protein-N(5)-glutamine methyltransferase PrmC, methylates polypeptide chain release factors RF1 and RF2 [uncultured Candidatus Thioglobus sp.]|nr:Protein-N(5)-glutamine methyltransferase PrmC, methylates polypeptide chain release factors RF1 and RF2 [uncultured Candidatus Thioglobus sp.]
MQSLYDYLSSNVEDIAPLLSLTLGKNSAWLLANSNYQLKNQEKKHLDALIIQRKKGIPFAYLSGTKGFYHLDFKVTPDTLIPRPETELLIDIALDLFKNKPCELLDLGTGSGIIAITLADKNPQWQVSATDFSAAALTVAKQNATSNIHFQQGDWLDAVKNQSFDLIISNPPYVEEDDPHLKQLTHEPISALASGKDGLDDIRTIINDAPKHLNPAGYLLLEHGYHQQAQIVDLLAEDFHYIQTFRDYNTQDRAILAQLQ